ncbi:hypothetical protein HY637_03960 [Candidatus Woesearchaeota archaeon]|nr:hypothetical protein [Candidatus Woesearchaeota archaeon]
MYSFILSSIAIGASVSYSTVTSIFSPRLSFITNSGFVSFIDSNSSVNAITLEVIELKTAFPLIGLLFGNWFSSDEIEDSLPYSSFNFE